MKAKIALRVASGLALVQGVVHASIMLFGSSGQGAEEASVVATMKAHLFGGAPGTGRSYWDYYIGYGLFAALTCVIEAALFWIASANAKQMRPVAALFLIANVSYAVLVSRYFTVPAPLVFDGAIVVCLGLAWFWTAGD